MKPEPPRTMNARKADALRGAILCASIVLCAAVFSFRFTSFLHAKELVLCVAIPAISVLATATGSANRRGFKTFFPLWFFIAIALFTALIVPAAVLSDAFTKAALWSLLLLAVVLVFDLLGDQAWRRRVLKTIGLSGSVVAAFGLIQYTGACQALFPVFEQYAQRVYSVFGNQDLYGGYLAIAIPILLHGTFEKQSRDSFLGLALAIPGILISGSRSAWLAAAIGTAAVLFLTLIDATLRESGGNPTRRRLSVGFVVSLTFVTILLAPMPTTQRIASSFRDDDRGYHTRLWIWQGTVNMFREAPFLGVGLGNYAYWSPRYLGESIQGKNGNPRILGECDADQPHSDPLRILAETGLAGIACCVWMGFRVLRAVLSSKHAIPAVAPAIGGTLALAAFSLFNDPLDSAPHAFSGLLLAGILLSSSAENTVPPAPRLAWPSVALSTALSLFLVATVHVPSCLLHAAESAHLGTHNDTSLYERAINYPWPNATAHKEYGFALAEVGRDDEARAELLSALKGLDTGDIYLALAIVADRKRERSETRRWATECLLRWPGNEEARILSAR